MSGDELREIEQALVQRALDDIARTGWHATGVFPVEPGDPPAWVYTTGLALSYGHPELCVYGLDPRQAQEILAGVVERIQKGERFETGKDYEGVLGGGYKVRFRDPQDRPNQRRNVTRMVCGGGLPPSLEMLWPDVQSRFPGDEGCDEATERLQRPV